MRYLVSPIWATLFTTRPGWVYEHQNATNDVECKCFQWVLSFGYYGSPYVEVSSIAHMGDLAHLRPGQACEHQNAKKMMYEFNMS